MTEYGFAEIFFGILIAIFVLVVGGFFVWYMLVTLSDILRRIFDNEI